MKRTKSNTLVAFTLIELMVVIAIIALLVGILIPAVNTVRTGAKGAVSQGTFHAIDTALESYKANQQVGGSYPPSASDQPVPNPYYSSVTDPLATGSGSNIPSNGAHLLAFALQGADYLGTTGFVDLPDGSGNKDGFWWDNVQVAYKVGTSTPGTPDHPRYGPFAGSDLQERTSTISKLISEGIIVGNPTSEAISAQNLPFYTDGFGRPILYYRARPAAIDMVTNPGTSIGVFDHRDNRIFGGNKGAAKGASLLGLDFGAGSIHKIYDTKYPSADPKVSDLKSTNFDNTFERFIWNPNVTKRNTPNKADSYLLISAGEDGLYGTTDDITNWSRDAG